MRPAKGRGHAREGKAVLPMNTKVEASMRGDGASGTRNTRPEEGRNFRINQKKGGACIFRRESKTWRLEDRRESQDKGEIGVLGG